jgi:hypothetical protein
MGTPFAAAKSYEWKHGQVSCEAYSATDTVACEEWLKHDVAKRVYDQPMIDGLNNDMLALKSENFDISNLMEYIALPTPDAHYWDIGESVADLFLIERIGARLPANRRRDLRTPKGSLPGADVAGYVPNGAGRTLFLFGEIKTSTDEGNPPSVMASSGSGMAAQLTRLVTATDIRRQLLYYLRDRSTKGDLPALFKSAMASLAEKKYALVGVLVRDTPPDSKDVAAAAKHMDDVVSQDQTCTLYALHTCIPMSGWAQHCKAA